MKTKRIAKALLAVSLVFTTVFSLVSCRKKLDDTPLEGLVTVADFSKGENESFFASNGWCNGEPFNVTWSKKNVKYEDGVAKLFITEKEEDNAEVPFYGGELRSKDHYHYGDYEITMKVEPKKGTCTSFFVYTGPSEYDENGNPNPHDEVDIEFLGKDTTHVQFNFFVNGEGGNEYMYDLGFDASEEFHRYGFRWTESYITWYVDGEPVYRVDEKPNKPLPKTPGRMMTNYWCGTKKAEAWMGKYDAPAEGEASEYLSISTSATPIVDPIAPDANSNIKWDEVSPLSGLAAVSSDAKHNISVNESSYRVQYNEVQGGSYNNVKFPLGKKAYGMNYLHLNLTNNSTDKYSTVRVDLVGDATNKKPNNTTICNMSATMDGEEVVTDLEWGGTTFAELEPGKTVTVIIYFEGLVTDLQIMFDSSTYQDTKVYAGDITVSNIKFAFEGELKLPEGVELPTEDEEEINWPGINALEIAEPVSSDESHTITVNGSSYNVVYSNLQGGSYNNVKFPLGEAAIGKNYVYLKVTNNGTVAAGIRVDVFGDATNKTNNNKNVCNVSATMNGNPVSTDMDWGGSTFDNIAVGATVELVIYFEGTATDIQIMFDSFRYQDTNTYNGDITINDIKFASKGEVVLPSEEPTVEIPTQGEDEPTVDQPADNPVEDNTWTDTKVTVNGSDKTFAGNLDTYSVVYKENDVKVSYTNAVGNTYHNVNFGVEDIAGTHDTFTAVITNNNDRVTLVRININSNTKINNTNASNISGTMNGEAVWTDLDWGGSKFEIPAGATVTCVVKFDVSRVTKNVEFMIDSFDGTSTVSNGSIIISDMVLSGGENPSTPDVPTEEPTDTPSVDDTWTDSNVAINGSNKVFEGNLDTYSVVYKENDVKVSYTNAVGNTYHNVNFGVEDIAGTHDTFTVVITNNNDRVTLVRININSNTKVNNTNASNISGTMNGEAVWTDLDWGGSKFEIPAGATVTCVVKFDVSRVTKNVEFMIDSFDGTSTVSSGSIVLKDMALSGETSTPNEPNENPEDEPVQPEIEYVHLPFSTSASEYHISNDQTNKSTNVTYQSVADHSWICICADFDTSVGTNNAISLTITNNGTEKNVFRFDAGIKEGGNLVSKIIATEVATFREWESTASLELTAGETKTITLVFEAGSVAINIFLDSGIWIDNEADRRTDHVGDITISNVYFSTVE